MNKAASSVEPEVKTRFATVDDAAFEKLLYEKLSYQRIWKMSRKQKKYNFHPNITLRMCHLIKQLMTFHFGGHWFINHFLGVDKSQCPPYESH